MAAFTNSAWAEEATPALQLAMLNALIAEVQNAIGDGGHVGAGGRGGLLGDGQFAVGYGRRGASHYEDGRGGARPLRERD